MEEIIMVNKKTKNLEIVIKKISGEFKPYEKQKIEELQEFKRINKSLYKFAKEANKKNTPKAKEVEGFLKGTVDSIGKTIKKIREEPKYAKTSTYKISLKYTNPVLFDPTSIEGRYNETTELLEQQKLPKATALTHEKSVTGLSEVIKLIPVLKQEIREKVKKEREKTKQLQFQEKSHSNYGSYTLCNGVFTRPGTILEIHEKTKSKVVFNAKTPNSLDLDQYVGIELEFFSKSSREVLGKKLYENGLGKYVHIKSDGSIKHESGTTPHEVAILAKETDFEQVVKKVCQVLDSDKAQVNDSCGMHIHLDMRNRNHKTVFSNLTKSQSILFSMNPASRRTNKYCKKVTTNEYEEALDNGNRYDAINAQAYSKHKTIEVRLHTGTTNPRKIINWVKLLLAITNANKITNMDALNLNLFAKKVKIDKDLVLYIKERIAKFNGKNAINDTKKDNEEVESNSTEYENFDVNEYLTA